MEYFLHDLSWVLPLRSDTATIIFNGFTWLGYTPFFLIFLPIGYWLWGRAAFTRLAVLVVITALVNGWLKDFWQDPRPDIAFQLDADRVSDSYGLPSGHAQIALVMWFWLAYEFKRAWGWVVAAILVAGVSFSRLYLGVHDVEDIIVGLALGLVTLVLFALAMREDVQAYWRRIPGSIGFAVIILSIPLLWLIWPEGRQPNEIAAVLFLLLGWFAGTSLDRRTAPEEPVRPAWWLQIIMAVGGILGLFAIRDLLTMAGNIEQFPEIVTGYITVFAIGIYATYIAPSIFRLLGLMKQPQSESNELQSAS